MKQEIQRQNAISTRTMLERRGASESQGGPAFRYIAFDPAQFCRFADNDEAKNWECVNCGRQIDKKTTFGNKPVVICNKPALPSTEEHGAILPIRDTPNEAGGVIPRRHRTAPTYGVGFEMRKIFRRLQIELPRGCVCNSRVMLLNDIGIDEVEKMRNKIMRWFEEEASKRALPYDESKATKILDISIRRARKQERKHTQTNAKKADG